MQQQILNKKQLIRAIILSAAIGALVLIVAVMPAEYGLDPTGAGKLIGFDKLYVSDKNSEDIVFSTNRETLPVVKLEKVGSGKNIPIPEEVNLPAPAEKLPFRKDEITISIPPKKGIEYKFDMVKHGKIKYEWLTNDGLVYIDFHGEVKQQVKPQQTYYESYTLGYSNNMAGSLLAPFEGPHGWYFRNDTDKNVEVTIRLEGEYSLK
ncbi:MULTISPECIES: hypothetical protein [Roseivirga]|uniref:Uncharacterized protein n=1 Tax=Roseivirga spongicola TaxID=333140 RepID=A0A150X5R2_9BACT|nr:MULTISPECIES: hypothetical protein [Roseivirga]KYG74067.1 hypothetical protein AWW68_15530 [Roseivirga spongicola]MBO6660379.1 hypothetical protein [Roseivirga sp.]MBO6906884.1 hypothetical protein [Roseivirga sp.]WPZ09282.1 hypothetical protein T7867_13545 [Roseivirga spongicola]